MRLLFIHERFGALGGAEANVLATASALRLRGHTVGLAHGEGTSNEEETWNKMFPLRFPLHQGSRAGCLQAALRHFRPEAVFLHKMADLGVVEALASCGLPVVRMVHDHDLYCMRGSKYSCLSRRICTRPASLHCLFPCGAFVRRGGSGPFSLGWNSYTAKQREIKLNRKFTRLIVATGYMKDELLRNGFDPGQVEIHAPVPPSAEDSPRPFGPSNRLIYAGQIIRGKGVDVLLEALARVRHPFECVILGDGNHRTHCEALSRRLGLAGKVRFLGFVPQSDVLEHYRRGGIALMSSVWPEPFGATGLEAMRCGLPVVAFDVGGISEWLIDGWNGHLVPSMDRERYAACVDRLLEDTALAREMGAHGRLLAHERFHFESYILRLENLFERVTHEPHEAVVP
jgi:glycosyltransferase involved in cell wall biosynthesis